jgi:hypothetical protein
LNLKLWWREKLEKTPPTMEYVRNLILDVKLLLKAPSGRGFFSGKKTQGKDMISALLYVVEPREFNPRFYPYHRSVG